MQPAGMPFDRGQADSLDDFEAVYRRHYQDVFRTVRAIVLDPSLSEDVTQETFAQAYRHRHRYQPIGPVAGWLHRIAVRQALTTLRWHAVRAWVLGMPAEAETIDPEPWLSHLLVEALKALKPPTRAAIVLHYYHGYRQREIAEILRVPEGTVATRIANGLRRMRMILEPPQPGGLAEP